MSLADEIAAARDTRHRGILCSFTHVYTQIDEDTAAELRTALADQTLPSTVIAEVLTRRGIEVGAYTVNRHRKQGGVGGCKCGEL